MRSSLLSLTAALLSTAALLAGCCANNTCNCDQLADAIRLHLNVSDTTGATPAGFRLSEVDTIRLVRYRLPAPNVTPTNPDTVVLTRPKSRANDNIIISNTAPFGASGTLKVNAYHYALLLTEKSRKAPVVRQRYDLTGIHLEGRYQADGCCTCYENTAKTAQLSVSPPGSNVPASAGVALDLKQIVELSRP